MQEYLQHAEGSAERERLERRFGKRNIQRLVAAHREEKLNSEWLRVSTTECPGCQVRVEKNLGCNHVGFRHVSLETGLIAVQMTCRKCWEHFCYRCGARVDRRDPYEHFSTRGLSCFNKLFDKPDGDEEWQAMDGFQ